MNKCAIIALAVVAACAIAVASANKVNDRHLHNDDDWEFEGGHSGHLEHRPQHHHKQHHNIDNDDDWEQRRHHCQHGECGHIRPRHHHESGKGGKHVKRTGGPRRGSVGGAGIGHAGAVGAVGGFKEHDGQAAGIEGRTRLGSRKSIEGHKGFIAGEEKGIKAGHGSHESNENEGIHKHQVLNRDKTIIKDRTTGVNDVDGFRHSSEKSSGAGFEAGEGKFVGGNVGGSAHSDKDFEHKFAAGEEFDRDVEAGGAVGGIGGVGAGVGGASF